MRTHVARQHGGEEPRILGSFMSAKEARQACEEAAGAPLLWREHEDGWTAPGYTVGPS
jgi:hypothetical protein